MERIIFYILAIIMIVFAGLSVSNRNIMRSIVYLLFVLLALAGIYFTMEYNFLGAVQMTVYAGGIIVLYINSIMLVEKINTPMDVSALWQRLLAGFLSFAGAVAALFAIWSYDFKAVDTESVTTIKDVGASLLSYGDKGYILPFEVISILLLAAMVGAIVIAKTNKQNSK
jgi:NADH-quinone oxidoreductase subunit J